MPKEIQVAVEGPGADSALAELLAIGGVVGHAKPNEEGGTTRDGGVLAVVASIVAITGGVVTIADKIIAWRDRLKARRLSVVIEDAAGNRLPLDNATPEQLTGILKTVAK